MILPIISGRYLRSRYSEIIQVFTENKARKHPNTVDPWAIQDLGVKTLQAVENPHITYSQSAILAVVICPWLLCIHGSMFMDSTDRRLYSIVVFTIEKSSFKWTCTVHILVTQGSPVLPNKINWTCSIV